MLELVGRYRIQERIGEGAMADVYRAHDPSINRSLAIKILKAEFRQNKEYAARFLREAKAAGALSHPNIVTIYDVGEVDGYPYILMELLEGRALNEVMAKQGVLPADQVMRIGSQLADALRYAHALGVVHRDIKPSNIMLDNNGSIKILDFGIARMTEVEGLLEADSLKTQVGQVLGTPRYMSPEQALGGELDGRSDLFSVGVILYELLTGRKAFAGVSAATLALQITQQDPEPISKLAPDSPRGLQFIITKLLSKRPERRFADGGQLASALRNEQSAYAAVMAEAESKQKYLPLQLRLTLMLGAITAVVLFGSIGTVLLRQYQALETMAITSGSAIASFVASNAALKAADNATLPPEQRDWLPVRAFVKVASEDPNFEHIVVVDSDGVVRASSDAALVNQAYRGPTGEKPVKDAPGVSHSTSAKGKAAFRFVKPIVYAGQTVGQVDVSLSKRELQSSALLTRSLMIMLGVFVLAVILAATYTLTRMLAQPIRRLNSAFGEAAKGNLDFRVSHSRNDEFGELFDSFNRFTQHVQDQLDAVESVALGSDMSPEPVPQFKPASKRAAKAERAGSPLTATHSDLDGSILSSPFTPPPEAPVEPPAAAEPELEPEAPQSEQDGPDAPALSALERLLRASRKSASPSSEPESRDNERTVIRRGPRDET